MLRYRNNQHDQLRQSSMDSPIYKASQRHQYPYTPMEDMLVMEIYAPLDLTSALIRVARTARDQIRGSHATQPPTG